MTEGIVVQVIFHDDGCSAEILDKATYHRVWRRLPKCKELKQGDTLRWEKSFQGFRKGPGDKRFQAVGPCIPAEHPNNHKQAKPR